MLAERIRHHFVHVNANSGECHPICFSRCPRRCPKKRIRGLLVPLFGCFARPNRDRLKSMLTIGLRNRLLGFLLVSSSISPPFAQTSKPAADATTTPAKEPSRKEPTHADLLRGAYGPYRANNDLLFYRLDLRVDPEKKFISGTNTIRFKMLADGTRIQLELFATLQIEKITMGWTTLKYERDGGTFYVDFPQTLRTGRTYSIDVHYSGNPPETGRFGCFTFKKDTSGHPWINTACEGDGAYVWWPNKEQWRDEPQEGMMIQVAVPNGLMDVSNGKFMGKKDLGDGYTRWDWMVHYPINKHEGG